MYPKNPFHQAVDPVFTIVVVDNRREVTIRSNKDVWFAIDLLLKKKAGRCLVSPTNKTCV